MWRSQQNKPVSYTKLVPLNSSFSDSWLQMKMKRQEKAKNMAHEEEKVQDELTLVDCNENNHKCTTFAHKSI